MSPNCIATFSAATLEGRIEESTDPIKIYDERILYIGNDLSVEQKHQVLHKVQKQLKSFSWDYVDMKGIHPYTSIHHIYTNDEIKHVRQPQRRMNPTLKDIVKDEMQKLLSEYFIYPISDSKWVSPLVVVPKKNRKW